MPLRAFSLEVIALIRAGASDEEVLAHIKARYRLVVMGSR
ncbi:hypothetical protein [Azospirillum argentinense]